MTRRLLAFDVSSSLETELAMTRTVSTVAGPAPSAARTARAARAEGGVGRERGRSRETARGMPGILYFVTPAESVRSRSLSRVRRRPRRAHCRPQPCAPRAPLTRGEIGGDCEMIHQMLTLNVSSPPAIELAVSHSTSAAAIRAHGTPPPTRAGDWARLREIGGDWVRCEHFMARISPSLSRD